MLSTLPVSPGTGAIQGHLFDIMSLSFVSVIQLESAFTIKASDIAEIRLSQYHVYKQVRFTGRSNI
ncbi:TPA: hypothetical protein AB5C39_002539 [Vibrio mimicus]